MIRELFEQVGVSPVIELPLYVSSGIRIRAGDNLDVRSNCNFSGIGDITIGHDVLIGSYVTIVADIATVNGGIVNKAVSIGDRAWVGAGVTVGAGVKIGHDAIIGAGSTVTNDVPPLTFVAGTPCVFIRDVTEADRVAYLD